MRVRRDTYGIPAVAIMGGSWQAEWGGWTFVVSPGAEDWHVRFYHDTVVYPTTCMSGVSAADAVKRACEYMCESGWSKVVVIDRPSITLESLLRFHPLEEGSGSAEQTA